MGYWVQARQTHTLPDGQPYTLAQDSSYLTATFTALYASRLSNQLRMDGMRLGECGQDWEIAAGSEFDPYAYIAERIRENLAAAGFTDCDILSLTLDPCGDISLLPPGSAEAVSFSVTMGREGFFAVVNSSVIFTVIE